MLNFLFGGRALQQQVAVRNSREQTSRRPQLSLPTSAHLPACGYLPPLHQFGRSLFEVLGDRPTHARPSLCIRGCMPHTASINNPLADRSTLPHPGSRHFGFRATAAVHVARTPFLCPLQTSPGSSVTHHPPAVSEGGARHGSYCDSNTQTKQWERLT